MQEEFRVGRNDENDVIWMLTCPSDEPGHAHTESLAQLTPLAPSPLHRLGLLQVRLPCGTPFVRDLTTGWARALVPAILSLLPWLCALFRGLQTVHTGCFRVVHHSARFRRAWNVAILPNQPSCIF